MRLIHIDTGAEATVGEKLTDFRGDHAYLRSSSEPHKPGSTGRVFVSIKPKSPSNEAQGYFPSVFGLKWIA